VNRSRSKKPSLERRDAILSWDMAPCSVSSRSAAMPGAPVRAAEPCTLHTIALLIVLVAPKASVMLESQKRWQNVLGRGTLLQDAVGYAARGPFAFVG
jgi:hypothetical protein